jgi:hypothetical protein
VLIVLLADLTHARTVSTESQQQFATQNDMLSFMTSAKLGNAILATFTQIAAERIGISLQRPDLEGAMVIKCMSVHFVVFSAHQSLVEL